MKGRQLHIQYTWALKTRTDDESEDESPDRELRVPDFYNSDTEPKSGDYECVSTCTS